VQERRRNTSVERSLCKSANMVWAEERARANAKYVEVLCRIMSVAFISICLWAIHYFRSRLKLSNVD
jgi:hypothetical protein